MKKIFLSTLSFLLIFSMVFVAIESVDPEPAFASGEFSCLSSDGKAYIFQSKWTGSSLVILRRDPSDSSQSSTTPDTVETFPSSAFQNHGTISEINSLAMDKDGNMYAVYKLSLIHI